MALNRSQATSKTNYFVSLSLRITSIGHDLVACLRLMSLVGSLVLAIVLVAIIKSQFCELEAFTTSIAASITRFKALLLLIKAFLRIKLIEESRLRSQVL